MRLPLLSAGCFLLLILPAKAQDTVVFKVKDDAMRVSLWPNDSALWTEQENYFVLRVTGEFKVGGIMVTGGKIKRKDSLFSVTVDEKDVSALITVLEILPDGTRAVCFTRKYTIRRAPQPVLKVCGVKRDSVMDLWDLHIRNGITAFLESQKVFLPVTGFSMVYTDASGQTDTLTTAGNKFNLTMREKLFLLNPGSSITIVDAAVVMPGGNAKILDPVRIFLAETGKRKVGY
ncbi:MAG: hypothetical protein IT233_00265 [Bacteroidia bacterium]|nr:hypothetical protein [Bacteroidia bacterium]